MMMLQELPDWLPWWSLVVVAVPAFLYLVLVLLVPFSVFGVKGRLELIEARLDEIQSELRAFGLRPPDQRGPSEVAQDIPGPDEPLRRAEGARRWSRRAEPRLGWPPEDAR